MLSIPPDLLARYDESLAREAIPEHQRPHSRRCLRFYLDFCAKYERPAQERDTVRAFVRKLGQKGAGGLDAQAGRRRGATVFLPGRPWGSAASRHGRKSGRLRHEDSVPAGASTCARQ